MLGLLIEASAYSKNVLHWIGVENHLNILFILLFALGNIAAFLQNFRNDFIFPFNINEEKLAQSYMKRSRKIRNDDERRIEVDSAQNIRHLSDSRSFKIE